MFNASAALEQAASRALLTSLVEGLSGTYDSIWTNRVICPRLCASLSLEYAP